jgi:hypothetical protein
VLVLRSSYRSTNQSTDRPTDRNPTTFGGVSQAPVVGAAAHVLDAEEELYALGAAMTGETEAALATERRWTWSGAEAAHVAAGNDPERREPWSDILQGRKMKAAAQR